MSLDDRFEGFVREVTRGGTRHGYAVRKGVIYEIIDGQEIRVYGRVVREIVYKYVRGHLKEIGRLDRT